MLIAERYRVLERLGSGGMATVLLAEDERLGRRVALKRLHPGLGPEVAERFRREARLGASLTHPNVVSVYDVVAHEDQVVLVMEYVEGRTLADMLAERRLSPEDTVELLRPLATALDHAHGEGVVHRDVKPANVLVRDDGTVKLADLGIATGEDLTSVTATGTALGTVEYMAPEQLDGQRVTAAADVHALATIAFEMLSARKARTGATPMEVIHRLVTEGPPELSEAWPEAPPEAGAVLRGAMAPDPAERPSSAGELVDRLRDALSVGTPARAPDPTPATDETAALSPTELGAAPTSHGAAQEEPSGAPRQPTQTPARQPPAAASERAGRAEAPPSPRRVQPARRRRGRAIAVAGLLAALGVAGVLVALSASNEEPKPAADKPREGSERSERRSAASALARPENAVRAFYERAAADRYEAAWSLAAPGLRAQLGGFDAFKGTFGTLVSIGFERAETTGRTADRATVAIATRATHTDRIDTCQGEVSLERSPASRSWLINRVAVDC